MELVVLGSGTLVPDPQRNSAGIAVFTKAGPLVFDLGRGVLGAMVRAGIDPLRLRRLYLSHWHPDHSCDLVPFLFARNYDPAGSREAPLTLTGPPGVAQFLDALPTPWPWLAPRFPLEVVESPGERVRFDGVEVTTIALEHGEMPNLGFRVEAEGRSIAYTGDTGPCAALLSLADRVDILVAECSLPDARAVRTHLSPRSLGEVARRAGCGKLVVTHLYPELDPAEAMAGLRAEFDGEIVLAYDGLALTP